MEGSLDFITVAPRSISDETPSPLLLCKGDSRFHGFRRDPGAPIVAGCDRTHRHVAAATHYLKG